MPFRHQSPGWQCLFPLRSLHFPGRVRLSAGWIFLMLAYTGVRRHEELPGTCCLTPNRGLGFLLWFWVGCVSEMSSRLSSNETLLTACGKPSSWSNSSCGLVLKAATRQALCCSPYSAQVWPGLCGSHMPVYVCMYMCVHTPHVK